MDLIGRIPVLTTGELMRAVCAVSRDRPSRSQAEDGARLEVDSDKMSSSNSDPVQFAARRLSSTLVEPRPELEADTEADTAAAKLRDSNGEAAETFANIRSEPFGSALAANQRAASSSQFMIQTSNLTGPFRSDQKLRIVSNRGDRSDSIARTRSYSGHLFTRATLGLGAACCLRAYGRLLARWQARSTAAAKSRHIVPAAAGRFVLQLPAVRRPPVPSRLIRAR